MRRGRGSRRVWYGFMDTVFLSFFFFCDNDNGFLQRQWYGWLSVSALWTWTWICTAVYGMISGKGVAKVISYGYHLGLVWGREYALSVAQFYGRVQGVVHSKNRSFSGLIFPMLIAERKSVLGSRREYMRTGLSQCMALDRNGPLFSTMFALYSAPCLVQISLLCIEPSFPPPSP